MFEADQEVELTLSSFGDSAYSMKLNSLLFVLLDASNIRGDGSYSYCCNHPVSGLLTPTTTSLKAVDCSHYFNTVYKCNRAQCWILQFELLQTLFGNFTLSY